MLANIAKFHNKPENDWNGWSEDGKNGLVELLALMVEVRSNGRLAKSSSKTQSSQ